MLSKLCVLLMTLCVAAVGVTEHRAAEINLKTDIDLTLAQGSSDIQQSLLELSPEFDIKLNSGWRGNLSLTLEQSGANVGLGTRLTFDDISRPIRFDDNLRLNLDNATLSWRNRSSRLTVGKQTFAWGLLDGIQITDRLDATTKRQAIFIEQRPQRISRWAFRAQFKAAHLHWDAGMIVDNSADQLAAPDSNYAVTASRYRAGYSEPAVLPEPAVQLASLPTFAIKATQRSADSDLSLVMIKGPETEPVIITNRTGISLTYPSRTLIGGTYQLIDDNKVWRFEIATILNQPINVRSELPLVEERERVLAGMGIDWRFENDLFLNIQVAVDTISGEQLVRPKTDWIATAKAQQRFNNDRLKISLELLSSLQQMDGALRPNITYQYDDILSISAGIDWVWGDRETMLGQFADTDRVWLKASWSM